MQAIHAGLAVEQDAVEDGAAATERVGAVAAVLGGLAILIPAAILVPLSTAHGLKPPLDGKEAQFYDFVQSLRPLFLAISLLQAAGTVATLLVVRALNERLRALAPAASATAAVYGYVGVAILSLAVAANVALAQAVGGGAGKEALLPTVTATFAIGGTAAFAGSLFHATWLALVNWTAARRGGLPRVIAYYGFAVVAVSLATALLGIKGFGPLTFGVWLIAAGAAMWTRPQPAPARAAAIP